MKKEIEHRGRLTELFGYLEQPPDKMTDEWKAANIKTLEITPELKKLRIKLKLYKEKI
jgi:hypothetical protein